MARITNQQIQQQMTDLREFVQDGFKIINGRLERLDLNGQVEVLKRLADVLEQHPRYVDELARDLQKESDNQVFWRVLGNHLRFVKSGKALVATLVLAFASGAGYAVVNAFMAHGVHK